MKVRLFFIIFSCMFSPVLYSQHNDVDVCVKDSLNIFIVVDESLSNLIDSFITDVKIDVNSYSCVTYGIDINLFDDESMTLCLDLVEQKACSDSLFLYKNVRLQQAFIFHKGILFQFTFDSSPYPNPFNYCRLAEFLEKWNTRQCVYFKEPPPDFYDTNKKGEYYIENVIKTMPWDYIRGKWINNIVDEE